jgi:hypothetical protein
LKSPLKSNALSVPSAQQARGRGHLRRMPLGAGLHRLGPLVDQAHRPAELPGGDREQRLHRDVELAAEAAADRRRARCAPAPGAIASTWAISSRSMYGRLGAGEDADPARRAAGGAVDRLGPAGLGLDVRVLDVAGLEARARPQRRTRRVGEGGIDVARDDAPRQSTLSG